MGGNKKVFPKWDKDGPFWENEKYQNLGLLQYKAGWGVRAEKVKYFTYDIDRGEFIGRTNYSRGIHNSLFKKMPNSISRAIGAAFYKHIG